MKPEQFHLCSSVLIKLHSKCDFEMHHILYNNKANEAKENEKWIKKTLILQIQNKVGINISVDDFHSIIHNVVFSQKKKTQKNPKRERFNTIYHSWKGWSMKDAWEQLNALAVPQFVIVIHRAEMHLLMHSNMLHPGRTAQHLDISNTDCSIMTACQGN